MKITVTEMNTMIKRSFELYDADGSGELDKAEIRILQNDLMGELGAPNITDDKQDAIIKLVDEDSDGKFSFEEYYKIICPILKKALE